MVKLTKTEAQRVLVAHAKGIVHHCNSGMCPDAIEGQAVRDADCQVCQALDALDEHELEVSAGGSPNAAVQPPNGLVELAQRVAGLNAGAGEIGAGMLAQLVQQANTALSELRSAT